MQKNEKCLENLGVTSLAPGMGLPMAHINCNICFVNYTSINISKFGNILQKLVDQIAK